MGLLRWALTIFTTLPSSLSQLISVSAQYCMAISKLIEKLDNALKTMPGAVSYFDLMLAKCAGGPVPH